MKQKEATTTFLVEKELRSADDFMSTAMLIRATNRNANQISAALHHLRNKGVVDVVVQPDGRGWWFALSAFEDKRTKTYEERTMESKPRRRRAAVKKKS